jgi:hypothetical protein
MTRRASPLAELVTAPGRLRAASSSLAVPRRALSVGRQRSPTDNHSRCPYRLSSRSGPNQSGPTLLPKLAVAAQLAEQEAGGDAEPTTAPP